VEASKAAEVLSIAGEAWAAGDYGGMPVRREDGTIARQLGTNVAMVTGALRAQGHADAQAGAAHLRWPESVPRPHAEVFGVLVLARQSVRWEQGSYVEHATTLHAYTVSPDGTMTPVEAEAKGRLVRSVLRGTVRRDPTEAPTLVQALQKAEGEIWNDLRRPTDADREARVVHAVTPLLAAVIG
jgi:hypothetical protein